MNIERMKRHVKLCRRNLRDKRVKCCAQCPFEDEIIFRYPELRELFIAKREILEEDSDDDKMIDGEMVKES